MSIPEPAPRTTGHDGLAHLAAALVDTCAAALPDLGTIHVLVPHAGLIAPFKRACAQAAAARGHAAIVAPQVRTWRLWAEEWIAAGGIGPPGHQGESVVQAMTPLARLSFVARHLQRSGLLLAGDNLAQAAQARAAWQLARGVLRLVDGLTEAAWAKGSSGAAADLGTFLARLKYAYGSAASVATRQLEAESRLVFSVWQALVADAALPDPAALRLAALEQVAAAAREPLFVLRHAALSPVEERFVALVGRKMAVQILEPPRLERLTSLFTAAWWQPAASGVSAASVASDALDASDASDTSPVDRADGTLSHVSILAARSLEAEARAGVRQIRHWLAEGKRDIALVALDRASARRLRALLERDAILLEDEGGWRLSTTSAAAAVMRLIDLAHLGAARADYREVLDLLKSPLVFAQIPSDEKRAALKVIERAIGAAQAATGLTHMVTAVQRWQRSRPGGMPEEQGAERLLEHLQEVLGQFSVLSRRTRASTTLSDWFSQCEVALQALGMRAALEADLAGQQVLAALRRAALELTGDTAAQPLAVWRDIVADLFETQEFRDTSITSPVKLTQLAATPLRRFEAVLVVGADAAHLLPPPPELPLVKSSVRHDFGLPGAEELRGQVRAALAWLIESADAVTFTWQAQRSGQAVALAPELELLERVYRRRCGVSLMETVDDSPRPAALAGRDGPEQGPADFTAAPGVPSLLPDRISVSAYASLIACPYQFFARTLLGLREEEEVRLTSDQRDVGLLLHRVLNRLHEAVPRFAGCALDDLQARFTALARDEARHLVGADYPALGWLARFSAAFPDYVAWQQGREADGWTFQQGEAKAERRFALDDAATLTLYGRLDRIDGREAIDNGCPEVAVLDYKTQGRGTLRERMKHAGEDLQLASYALLEGQTATVVEALYVPLAPDRDARLGAVQQLAPEFLDGSAEEARLTRIFRHLHGAARLPANALQRVCQHCEMRGLCRRALTEDAPQEEA